MKDCTQNVDSIIFNNISSDDFGLIAVYSDAQTERNTGLTRELKKGETNLSRIIANHYGAQYTDVIEFEFMLMHKNLNEDFTITESRAVNKWLQPDGYCHSLIFNTDQNVENIHYMATCSSITDIHYKGHNCKRVHFMCDSAFGYSPEYRRIIVGDANGVDFDIMNDSDENFCYPTIKITCASSYNDEITITNHTDNESFVSFNFNEVSVVQDKKILIVDSSKLRIYDGNGKPVPLFKIGWQIFKDRLFKNFYWLRLVKDLNDLSLIGDCNLEITYQFVRKAGQII